MVGPAKLLSPIVERISGDVAKTLKDPVVVERLERIGFELAGASAEEFRAYVKSEADKLGRVIRDAGIKPQ